MLIFLIAQNIKLCELPIQFALECCISFIHFCSAHTQVNIREKKNMDAVFLSLVVVTSSNVFH